MHSDGSNKPNWRSWSALGDDVVAAQKSGRPAAAPKYLGASALGLGDTVRCGQALQLSFLATVMEMFKNKRAAGKMKSGGSRMHIMTRDEVKAMWAARQATLKDLLEGL